MILSLIRLTRPYYSLPLSGGLIVITSYLIDGNFVAVGSALVSAFLSLYCVISASYILNDVCDIEVDKINCPNRILPTENISGRMALLASVILFIFGIIFSFFCGWPFVIGLSSISTGLIIYDLFSKKMGHFKNVFAAALTTSLYPLAFTLTDLAITSRAKVLFIHPMWLFFTTLGYEMLKDIQDTKGDSAITDKRLIKLRDNPMFLLSARLIVLTAGFLTLLPYLLGYCEIIYLVASMIAILLAALSWRQSYKNAIRCIYAEVFIITVGSLVDLLVYGS